MGKGEITEQLATLLKSLWSLQYDPEISDKFKSLVDKYGSQYKGRKIDLTSNYRKEKKVK